MTICIIPARYNSSRFPGKLLAKAQGKTILQRTYECAVRCKTLDGLYVATDDQRIADHVRTFGVEAIWTSPDCINGTHRIAEAVSKNPKLKSAKVILNLQGDHPCTSPETLDRMALDLIGDAKAEIATPVRRVQTWADFKAPHVVKCVFDQQGYALYFSRAPIPYTKQETGAPIGYRHIGLYAYRPDFLLRLASLPNTGLQLAEDLEQLQFLELGFRIRVTVVEDEDIGVDTPEDLAKLELKLCRLNMSSSPAESSLRSEKV